MLSRTCIGHVVGVGNDRELEMGALALLNLTNNYSG